ncbi:MAG: hypothetical protein GWN18_08870 [Thermoplasmata archaeon]|nr:hypothetical protein [Thermoplasmata archaeon]NIS12146.1 hypothetical protein [Thermoplasmata archaeon]NIS20069.1 hypothetical protein [Thermoplasmata archaeon]NIT77283.1 hypothetical protein [Thermoplasmata archaeon]NIU49171.1 hypothetical protein [Thermoplasmata archaeon]
MSSQGPRVDAGGIVPDDWPSKRPSFFQSDRFGLLLGIAGSLFLVLGVWLWSAGYTFDAIAALTLAALGIVSGALTFRRRRGDAEGP